MPKAPKLLFWLMLLLSAGFSFTAESSIRMIRSLSGPSGKVVEGRFVLDEIRNRFVFPQDNSLVVYFECKAPKGDYTLTAYWKDPQGRMVAIAPDAKIQTTNEELNAYWILMVDASKPSGIWTVEMRVNGQPVGSHSFELYVPDPPKTQQGATAPEIPTLNDLYRTVSRSLVWVYKLDGSGHRTETSSGVIVAKDGVLTAFQSIDIAAKIEIELSDGTKYPIEEIIACNRFEDWALLKVPTGGISPIKIGKPESIVIGEQSIIFSIDPGRSRIIGAVDIIGRRKISGYGERISTKPSMPQAAIGGPLMDLYGNIVGVIGGNLLPGLPSRYGTGNTLSATVKSGVVTVTPINENMLQINHPLMTMKSMLDSGILTPALSETPVLMSAATTSSIPKSGYMAAKVQYSRNETVFIYANWQRSENVRKGVVGLKVFDSNNKMCWEAKPKTLNLSANAMTPFTSSFDANSLGTGIYRVDVLWNDLPAWRTFISIKD